MLKSQTRSSVSMELTASQVESLRPLIVLQSQGNGGMIVGSVVPAGPDIRLTYSFLPKEIALKIINLVDEYTENAEVENA